MSGCHFLFGLVKHEVPDGKKFDITLLLRLLLFTVSAHLVEYWWCCATTASWIISSTIRFVSFSCHADPQPVALLAIGPLLGLLLLQHEAHPLILCQRYPPLLVNADKLHCSRLPDLFSYRREVSCLDYLMLLRSAADCYVLIGQN